MCLIGTWHVMIIINVLKPAFFQEDSADFMNTDKIIPPLIVLYIFTLLGVIAFLRFQCMDYQSQFQESQVILAVTEEADKEKILAPNINQINFNNMKVSL